MCRLTLLNCPFHGQFLCRGRRHFLKHCILDGALVLAAPGANKDVAIKFVLEVDDSIRIVEVDESAAEHCALEAECERKCGEIQSMLWFNLPGGCKAHYCEPTAGPYRGPASLLVCARNLVTVRTYDLTLLYPGSTSTSRNCPRHACRWWTGKHLLPKLGAGCVLPPWSVLKVVLTSTLMPQIIYALCPMLNGDHDKQERTLPARRLDL